MALRFEKGTPWVYALFATVVLSSALGNLSQTGLNAMLVTVCKEFSVSAGVGQMLTTSYMFTLGAIVPLSSYFMGRFRLKDLSLIAMAIFLAGSFVAAWAPSFAVLLIARIVQAAAVGMLMPLMQTLAVTRFPDGRKATAMGISGIAMGFAPNIGPTIGGAMVQTLGWRSFFWLLAGLSLILILFCLLCIARHDDASYGSGLDFPSFLLCTAGFGGVLVGCSGASSFSFESPLVWGPMFAGAGALALFVHRQRHVPEPLIDLGIFNCPVFRSGYMAQCLLYASFLGITLVVPLFVESFRGGTALEAGLVLLPGTVTALVVSPLAGVLTDKIGVRPVALVGGVLLVAGAVGMAFCTAATPLWALCAIQGVRNAGVSSLIGPLTSWSLSGLKGKLVSDGSAFGLASRQTCASIGTALMVFCIEGAPFLPGEAAFHAAFTVSAAFAVLTMVVVIVRVR